ncbi:hypothetical protein SRABI96_00757 [Peribacillus sp. Bi96]|nr:hypothetical protein SRABI96_00757 [Peribacillus sp. Bi96]
MVTYRRIKDYKSIVQTDYADGNNGCAMINGMVLDALSKFFIKKSSTQIKVHSFHESDEFCLIGKIS